MKLSSLKLFFLVLTIFALVGGRKALAQSIIFEDFEEGLRQVNPAWCPSDGNCYLWNHYEGEDGAGSEAVVTSTAHTGTHSLRITKDGPSGATYLQFYTYQSSDWKWHYIYTWAEYPGWQFSTYNRLVFWIKVAPGTTKASGGDANMAFGTYVRYWTDNSGEQETGNRHYYHNFNIPYTGEWHKCIVDTHPDHRRYDSGDMEQPDMLYPDPADPNHNYFDLMPRFYLDMHTNPSSYPAYYYYDDFEFYTETYPENTSQVYSINGVYVPSTNKLIVGWRRNKNENSINHEVRYAWSSIYTLGWNNATPAPNGTVSPVGYGGYNGMEYETTQISMGSHNTIYVAIKPTNSSSFRQIAIPLGPSKRPAPPANLQLN